MNIYRLSKNANDETIHAIAKLYLQQRTLNDAHEEFHRTVNGILLALDHPDQSGLFIAEDEGKPIGFAFYNIGVSLQTGGRYVWLNDLYVHEAHRNKGIARKLLLQLIYSAEKEGMKTIELETGVNNSVTKHLYNSLGFHDIISKRYGFNF